MDEEDGEEEEEEEETLPPKPNVRLLQSPWEAAQAEKQRSITSVTLWL